MLERQKRNLYTDGETINQSNHYGSQYGAFSDNKKNLPYDLATTHLDIYPMNSKSVYYRDTCTSVFIAGLFTIAKVLNQQKCLTTEEWV